MKGGKKSLTTTTPLLPVPVCDHCAVDDAHLDEDYNDDHHIVRQPQQTQECLRDDVDGADHIQDGHHHRQDHAELKRHQDTTPSEEFGPNVAEDGGEIL